MSAPIVWCVSASDSGGGAGLQADNAACRSLGAHPCHVVTGVTAQNTRSVEAVFPVSGDAVRAQIDALASDLPANAIKIGALPGEDALPALEALWSQGCPVVLDPVLRASTGSALAADALPGKIVDWLPRIALLTPNTIECEAFTGRPVRDTGGMEEAADWFLARGVGAVAIKGGHLDGEASIDLYADGSTRFWLSSDRVDTVHTHGTGCTFASVAAAAMAGGETAADSVVLAKMVVRNGLLHSRSLGQGAGPVAHTGWPSESSSLPALHFEPPPETQPPAFASCETETLGLYACVDSADWIERLLELGVRTLQLRNKTLRGEALEREVRRAHELCQRADARFFLNDYWQLAAEIGTYGVHLGQEDLDDADADQIRQAGLRLGVSTHSWCELARAHALRPSYLAFGPIYATTTKEMRFDPQGLERLGRWARLTSGYPQVAIGGIDAPLVARVMARGVGSVCVVRAITTAADAEAATAALQAEVARALNSQERDLCWDH